MDIRKRLKKELLEKIHDNRYKNFSFIEICSIDYKYIQMLHKTEKISEQSFEFLRRNKDKIEAIDHSYQIEYFRKLKYEELIETYCDKIDVKCKQSIDENDKLNLQSDKDRKIEKNRAKNRKNTVAYQRINILTDETETGKLKWEIGQVSSDLRIYKVVNNASKVAEDVRIIKNFDENNKLQFVLVRDMRYRTVYRDIDELESVILSTNPLVKDVKLKSQEEQAAKRKEIMEALRNEEKEKKEERRKKHEIEREKVRQALKEQKLQKQIQQEQERKKEQKKKKEIETLERKEQERIRDEKIKQLSRIDSKGFMVRRSVFKCMHNKHTLKSINAVVDVIDMECNVKPITVSAGYCEQCRIYFVLESSYQKLKNQGIPICRVNDEKTYLKNIMVNGMRLAQESILMQYGYTVSQEEGLSSSRRQKILAVMVDNGVITRSGIVSYLDFFINQRQYQNKYEVAISKWEADREFIESYRVGDYSTVGVRAIYR